MEGDMQNLREENGSVEDTSMNEETGNNHNNNNGIAAAAMEMMNAIEVAGPPAAAAAASSRSTARGSAAASVSHQSMLRQQAHSPAQGRSLAGVGRAAMPGARNSLERLELPQQPPQNQQPQPQQQLQQQQRALNINAANPNNNQNINPHIRNNPNPPQGAPERETETENVNHHPYSPSGNASSGWSIVETSQGGAGGAPPSPRSLHAAALLNGIMYVFGGKSLRKRNGRFFFARGLHLNNSTFSFFF